MTKVWLIVPVILVSTMWLYTLTIMAPKLNADNVTLHFPNSFQELKKLAEVLKVYNERNWFYVLVLFCSAYLYKQAFIIPGSALLNLLAGALFGVKIAFPLCCVLTGVGASSCYLIADNFGKETLEYYFPSKINFLREKVEANSHQLVYFLLFLRLFPMTPNWLINLLSPIVGIPLNLFFITVVIGLMPYNLLCIQAGEMLSSFSSMDQVFSIRTLLQMTVMAVIALGPTLFLKKTNVFSRRLKSWLQTATGAITWVVLTQWLMVLNVIDLPNPLKGKCTNTNERLERV